MIIETFTCDILQGYTLVNIDDSKYMQKLTEAAREDNAAMKTLTLATVADSAAMKQIALVLFSFRYLQRDLILPQIFEHVLLTCHFCYGKFRD